MPRRMVRRAGLRRRMIWARQAVIFGTIAAGGTASQNLLTSYLANTGSIGVGLTVTRVVAHFNLFVDGGAAVPSPADGFLGGFVVSEQATPTPPSPLAQSGADWMDWYWYRMVSPGSTVVNPAAGAEVQTGYDRDIHSQRRIDEVGQSLFFTILNTSGVSSITVQGYVSTLLKLP